MVEHYWKSRHWFFGEVNNENPELTGVEFRHFKVRRVKKGEEVVLFSGKGELFLCRVEGEDKEKAHLKVLKKKTVLPPDREIFIGVSWHEEIREFLRNCASLIAKKIFIFSTRFSHPKRLSPDKAKVLLIEGCKQARNPFLPEVYVCNSPESLREHVKAEDVAVLHTSGDTHIKDWLKKPREKMAFIIGPEGGFSTDELNLWKSFGWKTVKISDTVIKTEHMPPLLAGVLSCLLN